MELNPQIIKKDGKNEFVVFTYSEFEKIQEALTDYEDLIDLRKAKSETINEPTVSFKEVKEKFKK